MESLRKWLNKPKADDKSLLARFYHADRALQGISSELDSFDGRAEPERCSRLVGKLRQGQDRVLVITNQIMDELLGDDRAPRAFRAKFPEEVLQESLAGQLWFGAECLAAGSSIMNREMESTAMRPLAKAVTKSLENVRSLLREQCLRNNIPNSLTLKLDLNDSATDKLYESLKIFDRLFAEFEFLYVSAMVQVKSNHEHEVQELISVLYSETLQRALKIGLLEQEQVDSFDPSLMFSIPRLSIVTGLIIYDSGPLNMEQGSDQMSEMFRPFRKLLIKMRDLLRTLNKNELYQLEKLLCTNEEINLKKQFICDDGCISSSGTSPAGIVVDGGGGGRGDCSNNSGINDMEPNSVNVVNIIDDNDDVVIVNCNQNNLAPNKSTMTTAPTTTASNNSNNNNNNNNFYNNINSNNSNNNIDNWCGDDDDKDINVISDSIDNLVTSDCASGYLIPNTNFGNLLQTNEAPLTDSFISSDDEYNSTDGPTSTVTDALSRTLTNSSSSSKNRNNHHNNNNIHNDNNNVKRNDIDSGICTENTSLDHSPDIENRQNLDSKINNNNNIDNNRSSNNNNNNNSNNSGVENDVLKGRYTENWVNLNRVQPSCSKATPSPPQQTGHSMLNIDANSTTDSSDESETNTICDINNPGPSQQQQQSQPSSQKKLFVEEQQRDKQRGTSSSGGGGGGSSSGGKYSRKDYKSSRSRGNGGSGGGGSSSSHAKRSSKYLTSSDTSSSSPSSSQHSEGSVDRREVDLALRAAGRLKFKTTENLLHRLFVCIAGVADQLQTNFAADLRQILKSVFLINSTPPPEEITIEEKGKESDLFEFRASESDVIQQENNSGGSNQSIYSAEEVNPEANDCVFEDAGSGESQRGQRSASLGNENSTRYDSASIGSGGSGDDNVMIDNEGVLGGGGGESGNIRNNIERSSSVGDAPNSDNVTDVNNSIKYRINITTSTTTTNNNNNNNNNNINSSSININNTHLNNRSRSNDGSPVNSSSRANAFISSSSSTSDRTSRNRSISATETPPRWIPDHEVRNCMACVTPFTPFRRRHHCRNCGGVFCNICSKSQKPLPKYGLIKAVRVCRDCFEDEDCN